MLQVVLDRPGSFSSREVEDPSHSENTALVRVRRIGICGTDLHAFAGRQPFFEYPRVLGHELGVEVVSSPTGNLEPGSVCAIEPYLNDPASAASKLGKTNCCEGLQVLGVHCDGGMQELLAVPAEKLHRSESLDCDTLALVETLGIGAHAIERGNPTATDRIAILGAGPIGLATLAFATLTGAPVCMIDVQEHRLQFCREAYGVSKTIQVEADLDLETALRDELGGALPTMIFDATGNRRSMESTFGLIAHGGKIVFVGLQTEPISFENPNFHRREISLLSSRNAPSSTFPKVIAELEAGRIDVAPWITHRMALQDVPAEFPKFAARADAVKGVIEVP